MTKPNLKLITNTLRSEKRVLPKQEMKPLSPPKFEIELVDMTNKNIKWYFSLFKI